MRLSFRKKLISDAAKKRIALLAVIFATSTLFFSIILNIQPDVSFGVRVSDPTLPSLTITSKGTEYGEFFGYKTSMDLGRVRNGLVPLDKSRKITLNIDSFGSDIQNISYEISSGDGNYRLSGGDITDFEKIGDRYSADLTLTNLTEEGREYMMTLSLNSNGAPLYYYLRIKYAVNCFEDECQDFARYFMETSLSDNFAELSVYMEPDGSPRRGFSYVNIHSTLSDVGWSGFDIFEYTAPKVSFAEIDESYTALNQTYVITGNPQTNPGTFLVKEYYRMRKGDQRIFLLDFDRTVTEVFSGERLYTDNNKLVIGQNGADIEFLSNRAGTNMAFVWNGELYEYNSVENTLSLVFRFGKFNLEDTRSTHREYGIKLLEIDENGNINFVVLGYMNSGPHEGVCGIGLYHYDFIEDNTTETAFLAMDASFTSLISGFDNEIYLSGNGELYLCFEDEMIYANMRSGQTSTRLKRSEGYGFAMSEEGRYLAYSGPDGDSITLRDLFANSEFTISPRDGKRLKVMTFMSEDLVYGEIDEGDYTEENIIEGPLPIKTVIVADITVKGGQTLKTYEKPGVYVTDFKRIDPYNLSLELSTRGDGGFAPEGGDSIQNTTARGDSEAVLSTRDEDKKQKIALATEINAEAPSIRIRSMEDLTLTWYENDRNPFHRIDPNHTRYYAFRGMDVVGSDNFAGKVVDMAYQAAGYSVDSDANYIWQYGRGASQRNTKPETLIPAIDDRRINLTGCTLEEMLSYVYRKRPVFVNENTDNPLIITGFDSSYITIYYPKLGVSNQMLIDDAAKIFENQGRKYSTYLLN